MKQIEEQLNGWDSIISRYFTWVEILTSLPLEQLQLIDPQALQWKDHVLSWKPSLEMLASHNFFPPFDSLIAAAQRIELPNEIKAWGKKLQEALSKAQWFAGEKLGQVAELIKEIDLIFSGDELPISL